MEVLADLQEEQAEGKTQEKGQVKKREWKGPDEEDLTGELTLKVPSKGRDKAGEERDANVEGLEGQPTLMDMSPRQKNPELRSVGCDWM